MSDDNKIATDRDRAEVLVVGGPHPYLWIGVDGKYLDSFDLSPAGAEALIAASKRRERKHRRVS